MSTGTTVVAAAAVVTVATRAEGVDNAAAPIIPRLLFHVSQGAETTPSQAESRVAGREVPLVLGRRFRYSDTERSPAMDNQPVTRSSPPEAVLIDRIRGEYLEMPG